MSDRLLSQLADRLGLDESDVAPMLNALLKQVRQRAGQGSGARIPTLGTFTTNARGTLQFEPDDDLVDAVNEDFAGLEDEPAPTPKRAPDTSTALAEASPPEQTPPDRSSPPSTPDASETGATTEDDDATKELPASGPAATESSDTGSLWPSEANAPTSPDSAKTDTDDQVDDDFWSRDREWDLSSVAFGDVDDDDREPDDAAPSPMPSDQESPSTAEADSSDRGEASSSADVAPEQGATDGSPTQRSGLRSAVGAIVLLAALIGGWIFLGAQGTVPGPGTVIENVRASFSGDTEAPAVTPSDSAPSTASDESGKPDLADSPPESSDSAASDESIADESTDEAPRSDEAPADDDAPSNPIVPAEGGWTLVVASPTSEQEAEATRQRFATALGSVGVPVDILPGEDNDGTTRYRVVVGQFSSQEAARRIQQEYSEVVPDDAWPLRL